LRLPEGEGGFYCEGNRNNHQDEESDDHEPIM
jgi:hypothetical protein